MSYGLAVAGDAWADLRSLDTWLQEAVFDELELLLTDPGIFPSVEPGGDFKYGFRREHAGMRRYVVLSLSPNVSANTLTLLGVYGPASHHGPG